MASKMGIFVHAFLATSFIAAGVAEATSGLRATESAQRVGRELVAQQLFSELSALLGHGASHDRLARIEDVLRPTYTALPKTEDGGVDQGVARYALTRYFLTHHGWHIRGIAPDGERWNASSSTTILKSKMPAFVFELLEEHVGGKRLGLGELAVLIATVEDLVHSDAVDLLMMAYATHNISTEEPLASAEEEELVIKTFMIYFLMPSTRAHRNDGSAIRKWLPGVHKAFPNWQETVLWLEDVKAAIRHEDRAQHNPFSPREEFFRDFPSMVHLVERFVDGLGTFQDLECKMIKNKLMDLEEQDRKDGRVLLAKFYVPYMTGLHRFFMESPEYLRSLGSLDESDPSRPGVIVPNFLNGRNMCTATDGFQSFCCIDECNVLMDSLERSIAHPVASPSLIAELVAALPSATVAAPRTLSDSLHRKLDQIADQHGGHVPLHGRLFVQWMHHAFPNECPQPRAPGATESLMTAREWKKANANMSWSVQKPAWEALVALANETEEGAADRHAADGLAALSWTEEEELVTSLDYSRLGTRAASGLRGQGGVLLLVLRFAAMCCCVVCLGTMLMQSLRSSAAALELPGGPKKSASGAAGLPLWFGGAAAPAAGKSHFV